MAIYSLSLKTTNTTTANACLEIITASTNRPRLLELGLSLNAATASEFGLGRPAAIGITPTTPVTFLAEDPADAAATVTAALAWGTGPTIPTNFFRRVSLPATVGAGVIWTFPRGLLIPISSSLILWNLSTTSAADIWAIIDE